MRDKNVVVLDIQSSKISVLVGYESVNQNYKIVCKNLVDYAGFMQGKFLLEEKLEEEISNVLNLTQINYNRLENRIDELAFQIYNLSDQEVKYLLDRC